MRTAFESMGTVVSLEVDDPAADLPKATETVHSVFQHYDELFSLYRPQSELSRVERSELALQNTSVELREVYADALEWRDRTNGAFTPHRLDDVIDLNGIVKALAIEAGGRALHELGIAGWQINAGGDILFSQAAAQDAAAAVVGISDPTDRGSLLCSIRLAGSRRAVATSGSSERGDHIWSSAPDGTVPYLQATVVADDIVTADVLATALIAGGAETLELVTSTWPVDVLVVDPSGEMLATPGFRAALA
jgi:thiamine biosynthesis lipoprotein